MSFTFGFYNSVDHDRLYDAIQVSKIFDGIILDGVYETIGDAFIVQASEEPNVVTVGPGRAWFDHTWNENDGYLDLELEPAETILHRIDAVVIDVDGSVPIRKNDLKVVTGTPSSTPAKPTLINELEHHQYPLCYITVPAASTTLDQANIENTVGTSACPFVTGVLETLDTDLLIQQWQAGWQNFLQACQTSIDAWQDVTKEDVATFVAAFKTQVTEYLNSTAAWQTTQREDFKAWYDSFKEDSIIYTTEYIAWVDSLKDILAEDALGNLLFEIEKVRNEVINQTAVMEELINGFVPRKTEFLSDKNILVTFSNGSTINTVFKDNGDIEETLTSAAGVVGAVKLTEFKSDTLIVESITGGSYLEYSLSLPTGVGAFINNNYELNVESMNGLNTINDVANDNAAMLAIRNAPKAWGELYSSKIAVTAFLNGTQVESVICTSPTLLKKLVTNWWDMAIANTAVVDAIVDSRDVLKFIFDDSALQKKFTGNAMLMRKIQTSSLKQQCIFCTSNGSENHETVIKNTAWSKYPQWDIHTYSWAVFFGRLHDGKSSPVSTERCYIEFHPTGQETPSYNWQYDPASGYTLPGPVVVNIAGGAYALSTRRIVATGMLSSNSATGMIDCVAF